jgi:hypothetical protein
MHIKRAYLAGEFEGEPLVHLIRPGEMVKTSGLAPESQKFINGLRPDPRYTYVLCNAMGYSEFYGANSNKDWYGYNPHLDFNGLLHAWPDIGRDIEADQMKGKGWPYGYPCYYGATVYAHHKNTDPQQLGFGDVIFAALNVQMKRIELVKRVFNDEAQKKGHTSILDRVRAGERVDVSMGCKVPFDLCSICTDWDEVKKAWQTYDEMHHRHPGVAILAYHKQVKPIRGLAVTKVDYCQHMVSEGGKVYPDGRKVFVYNDFPRFFDISFVWIGADRTARVMWHLADPDAPKTPASMKSAPPGALERLLELLSSKSASMEKDIPGGLAEAAFRDADTAPEILDVQVMLQGAPSTDVVRKILSTLSGLGVIPTPGEFQGMVLPLLGAEGSAVKKALDEKHATFDTRLGGIDNTFAVDPSLFDSKLAHAYEPLMDERSSFAPYLHARFAAGPEKTASKKRAQVGGHELMRKLASFYNGYRLSVLEHAESLFPKAAEYLGTEDLLDSQEGGIGKDLAGLLLGHGPVIQLISSHLRRSEDEGRQIGTMAQIIATNPSFYAMSTIGTALRQAMGVDKSLGMTQAASSLVGEAGKGS